MPSLDEGVAAAAAPAPRTIDYAGAAAYLNIGERALRRLVSQRRVPHQRLGKAVRFIPAQLDEWLEEQTVGRAS